MTVRAPDREASSRHTWSPEGERSRSRRAQLGSSSLSRGRFNVRGPGGWERREGRSPGASAGGVAQGHLDRRAVRRHSWTVSTLAAAGHAGQRGPPWGPTRVPALRWAAGALGPLPDPSTGIINALAAPLSAGGFSRPSRQSEPDAVARGDPSLPAGEADRGHLLRGLGRADGYQQDKLPRRTQGQPQGRRAFPG